MKNIDSTGIHISKRDFLALPAHMRAVVRNVPMVLSGGAGKFVPAIII